MPQVVTVDGAEIFEIECLEEHARRQKRHERFLGPFREVVDVSSDPGNGSQQDATSGLGFAWHAAGDTDTDNNGTDDEVTYTLEIWDSGQPFYRQEGITKTVWYIDTDERNFENGKTYTWQVTAVDEYGLDRASATWSFLVVNQNARFGIIQGLVYDLATDQPIPSPTVTVGKRRA